MSRVHSRKIINLVARVGEIITTIITYRKTFVSNVTAATGAAQEIAHGLGGTPDKFIVVAHNGHNGAGAAGTQMPTFTVGTVDSTKITVTATAGASFYVVAWDA